MKYYLKSYFGGLGDNLQFSTLPEMLTNAGNEVYLIPDANYRNPEIKQFVWGNNPFIQEAHGEWNAGDIPNRPYQNTENDFIKNIEKMHGLIPKNSLPKIYYSPKKIHGIEGLIELSAISLKYEQQLVSKQVTKIIEKKINFKQIFSPKQNNNIGVPYANEIIVSTLSKLADLIYSCKTLITLNSGVHALAAAISRVHKFDHYCLLPEADYDWIIEQKKFIFPDINYIKCE